AAGHAFKGLAMNLRHVGGNGAQHGPGRGSGGFLQVDLRGRRDDEECRGKPEEDRKSTRLNSSHVKISYAVFCLKKKKNNKQIKERKIHMMKSSQNTPRRTDDKMTERREAQIRYRTGPQPQHTGGERAENQTADA